MKRSHAAFALVACLAGGTSCTDIPQVAFPAPNNSTSTYQWGWNETDESGTVTKQIARTGSGQEFCADLERGLRGRSASYLGGGYVFGALGTASIATGTVLVAANGEDMTNPEVGLAVAAPLLGAGMLTAAYYFFDAARRASNGASEAAAYAGGTSSYEAMRACNGVIGEWNGERALAAARASEQASEEAEFDEESMEIFAEYLEYRLREKLGLPDAGTGGAE